MTGSGNRLEFVLANQPNERRLLLSALNEFAEEHKLPAEARHAADLALEEHITNVISYGYDQKGSHNIRVEFSILPRQFEMVVSDDGKAFNPLQRAAVDTSRPLDQKPIGGLGIHLIRKFMDEVEYRREGGRNILTMRKRLPAAS